MNVLDALALSPTGLTSTQLARRCGISTSTCALVLAELEGSGWVARYDDRRYGLGSGLFGLVHGLRNQFPYSTRAEPPWSICMRELGGGLFDVTDRRGPPDRR
jgi:DNA-binding IclR family transcriptional regulator